MELIEPGKTGTKIRRMAQPSSEYGLGKNRQCHIHQTTRAKKTALQQTSEWRISISLLYLDVKNVAGVSRKACELLNHSFSFFYMMCIIIRNSKLIINIIKFNYSTRPIRCTHAAQWGNCTLDEGDLTVGCMEKWVVGVWTGFIMTDWYDWWYKQLIVAILVCNI
jgi:hypothetical protein